MDDSNGQPYGDSIISGFLYFYIFGYDLYN